MNDWRKAFWAVLAAEVLAVMGFNASGPIIAFYIESLGVVDPVAIKLWNGASAIVVAVFLSLFAPVWGRLADSVGKRAMLLRSMLGGGAVMALMGIVTHPWQFVVLRAMQGALAGTVAAATMYVASISPKDEMGYTLGLLQTGIYVGASVGPTIGGAIAELLGFRANFFVNGAFLLAAAVIVLGFVPRDPPTHAMDGVSFWKRVVPDFSPVIGSPGLLTLLLISGSLQAAGTTINPILPLFIKSLNSEASGASMTTGLIMGLSALAAALAAAGLSRVSRRIGYERVLWVCLAGAFLIFLPQGLIRSPWQLLILRMLGGAMIGASEPSLNAMIALRSPKSRQGAVFGLASSVNNLGATVGPAIGAGVVIPFGYPAAFFAGAAVLLTSSIAARTLRSTRQTSS